MYRLLRPFLFTLDPEAAHHLTFAALEAGNALSLVGQRVPDAPRKVMGLEFRNPVGMAAGMDKNGAHIYSPCRRSDRQSRRTQGCCCRAMRMIAT